MAGTGFFSASAGSQIRAASFVPSFSGMKTFSISRTLRSPFAAFFAMGPLDLPARCRRLNQIPRHAMLKAAGKKALAIGIGVDMRVEDEMRTISAHADARLQPCMPVLLITLGIAIVL